ncbi:MAG: sulfatase-like hydrolase/transferase [Pirellulales bacterium]
MSITNRPLSVQFLIAILALGPLSRAAVLAADERPRRPNILFVCSDDQRWDTIAALGNPEIKTPHLDRLVERGFHFTNAYCMGSMVSAVCLPSRTMLLTGRSLWRIPEHPGSLEAPPGVPLLPAVLREAGYVTFHCGKMGNSCRFGHAAFDVNIETQGRTAESASQNADHAITFLRRQDGSRPFFMYLAPPVPHDPRLAPAKFAKMYDPATLSLSKNFMPEHPFDNGELRSRDELLAAHPRTPEEMRRHLADYYGTISHLDREVGRVLREIEKRGWENNTIVIYSSDQGLAVGGRHGLMGKQNLYEHVKPPLVIAGPGIPHGKSDALVYLLDLFPTICDFAGAVTPETVEGRSLVSVLANPQLPLRDYLLAAYKDCQRMVRDRRFKLVRYNASGVRHTQLFDLAHDPDEINNLAGDPSFAAERKRLEALMAQARREFDDPVDF